MIAVTPGLPSQADPGPLLLGRSCLCMRCHVLADSALGPHGPPCLYSALLKHSQGQPVHRLWTYCLTQPLAAMAPFAHEINLQGPACLLSVS